MSQRNYNNITTPGSLTGPVASSATTLPVTGFTQYPTPPFTITVDRNTATEEICLVTAVTGTNLTVTRGFDGTAGFSHSAGAMVEHTAGAIEYTEANTHNNATSGVHGTTGLLVGAEGAQSLFDKTLVSPVLAASATDGDAAVAQIPPGAEARNLYRGINSAGADVATIDSSGNATFAGHSVTSMNSRLSTAEGTISSYSSSISSLNTSVSSNSSAITSLQSSVNGATSAGTANTIVKRDASSQINVNATPTATTHAASKSYVDSKFADTDWQNLTLTAPVNPTAAGAQYRVKNGVCYFAINTSYTGTFTAGFNITTFPSSARPSVQHDYTATLADNSSVKTRLATNGTFTVITATSGSAFSVAGCFPVG